MSKLRQKELEPTQAGLKGKRAALKQAQLEENAELITKIQDEIKAEKQKWKEIIRAGKDARSEQRIAEEEYKANQEKKREEERKKEEEDYKKRVEAWKKFQAERLELQRYYEDLLARNIDDVTASKIRQEKLRFEREALKYKDNKAIIEQLEIEHQNKLLEIQGFTKEALSKLKEESVTELFSAEELANQKRIDEQNRVNAELKQADDEYWEGWGKQYEERTAKQIAQDERRAKRKVELDEWEKKSTQEKSDMMYNATKGTLDAISSITELFAGKSKEQQRKAFKVQKGIQIAGAIIDTYKSANAAFQSMAGIPYVGPVLGGIAAAGAVAAGIINVKKISATQFDEGGGTPSVSGGGASAPNMNVGSNAPQFSIQGASGVNQLANTVNAQQPVKAYVVSSEMSSAQSLERNKIENATL